MMMMMMMMSDLERWNTKGSVSLSVFRFCTLLPFDVERPNSVA